MQLFGGWGNAVRNRIAWLGVYLALGAVLLLGFVVAARFVMAPEADPARCGESIVALEFAGSADEAAAIVEEWQACTAQDGEADGVELARTSIERDSFVFIPAYVVTLAYWCLYGSWSAFKSTSRRLYGRLAFGALLAGALDIGENVFLARMLDRDRPSEFDAVAATALTWVKWPLVLAVTAAALVALVSAVTRWSRAVVVGGAARPEFFGSRRAIAEPVAPPGPDLTEDECIAMRHRDPAGRPWIHDGRPALGVCCSGGGIRAASFALGALQVLQETHLDRDDERSGVLASARYLATVSGGGYSGTAYQVLARQGGSEGRIVLGSRTDEFAELRDHRRFLWGPPVPGERLASTRDFLTGVFTAVAGIVFNLFVVLGLLYVVARPLGWAAHAVLTGVTPGLVIGWIVSTVGFAAIQIVSMPTRARVAIVRTTVLSALGFLLLAVEEVHGLVGFALPVLAGGALWVATWLRRRTNGGPLLAGLTGLVAGFVYALGWWWVRSGRRHGTGGDVEWRPFIVIGTALVGVVVLVVAAGLSRIPLELLRGRWRAWLLVACGATFGAIAALVAVLGLRALWYDARDDRVAGQGQVWVVVVALLGATYLLLDQKRWSPHPIYKRRLARTFALTLDADGLAQPLPYRVRTTLSDWGRQVPGGPQLLVCAATYDKAEQRVGDVPVWPFVFGADHVGGAEVGWTRAIDFEAVLGKANGGDGTLLAAMAISGAAVSPAIGSVDVGPFSALIALLNARLGVWLPSPVYVHALRAGGASGPVWTTIRRATHVIKEIFSGFDRRSRFVFVTDGGQLDNLGLTELLARGCETVLCFDASGDNSPGDEPDVGTLAGVAELARHRLGMTVENVEGPDAPLGGDLVRRVPPDPTVYRVDGQPFVPVMPVVAGITTRLRVTGPAGPTDVVVAKAVLTNELDQVAVAHAATPAGRRFPSHSTVDQWLDLDQFDAYVALGRQAATTAIAELRAIRSERR
jgi:Lysophospholipase catalytic domain